MSMLSAQCDELRAMAESVGLAMPQAATLMMDAADTIWQLRGSVHRERAEADRLRDELADAPKCETCEAMLDCDECLRADKSHKERRRLSAENAKLRELASGLHKCLLDEGCEGCPMQDDDGWCVRDIRLHELGVGVTV